MSQGPLCPNLTQKVQKEVSQMANRNFSLVILLGGLSVNLNHLIKLYLLQIEVRILEESEKDKDKDKVEAGQHSEEKKADKEKQDVSIVSPWHISYFARGKRNSGFSGWGIEK